jgi:flavin-dependent dehydrogenase
MGIDKSLAQLGPTKLTRSVFVGTDGRETSTTLSREMWGISRPVLDSALLDSARDAGVTVHQPARVEGVRRRIVFLRDLESNEIRKIRCRQIVLSDGKAAFGAERPNRSSDLGMQAHFQAVDDDPESISLFSLPGHYCGLAPVEGGLWNVAMSVPAHLIRKRKLDEIWLNVLHQNAGFKHRMRRARQVTPWLAAPLPRFGVQGRWTDEIVPIGNAAAALEPIGGEGMGLAMQSAEIAADAIDAALRERCNVDVKSLRWQYRHLWRCRSLVCRASGIVASHPSLARCAISILSLDERLGRMLVALTGKSALCR